ncbi:MAG: hypothetical protein ACRCZE_01010 [Candidatus Altimarinota bacterium]
MNRLLNKIFFITTGIFLGAVYLLLWMKLLSLPGVVIGLATSLALSLFLKKHLASPSPQTRSKSHLILQQLNFGLLAFSIFMSIASIIVYIVFYSALQGLIS